MTEFNTGRRGGLAVDRDSLHASEGYKRQIAALQKLNEGKAMSTMLEELAATMRWMLHGRARDFLRTHHATIAQNAIDAAKYNGTIGTHSEGCHTWGPRHYECAMRRLKALEQAMDEFDALGAIAGTPQIRKRADEIMRGGE